MLLDDSILTYVVLSMVFGAVHLDSANMVASAILQIPTGSASESTSASGIATSKHDSSYRAGSANSTEPALTGLRVTNYTSSCCVLSNEIESRYAPPCIILRRIDLQPLSREADDKMAKLGRRSTKKSINGPLLQRVVGSIMARTRHRTIGIA